MTPQPPNPQSTDTQDELRELLIKAGWKHYDELNGWRKESSFTMPMWSTDQEKSYDSISDGNFEELKALSALQEERQRYE